MRGAALLRTRRMPIFELTIGQANRAMKCIWFHGTYLNGKFHAGQTIAVYGKIEPSRSTSNFKMIQPQWELLPGAGDDAETRLLEVGRITPVYESLGGSMLASRWQRRVIFNLLETVRGAVPECLPTAMLARLGLPDRESALREVHYPPEGTSMAHLQAFSTPAHRRLIFEELFFLELGLELKRRRLPRARRHRLLPRQTRCAKPFAKSSRSIPPPRRSAHSGRDRRRHAPTEPHAPPFAGRRGLGQNHRRPAGAMIVAIENGYQAALMKRPPRSSPRNTTWPHANRWRNPRAIYRIVLLTGSLDDDRKRRTRGLHQP